MDKEKAIEILTEELTKNLDISIVRDARWQDELKEKSMHFYQHSNPFIAGHRYYPNIKCTNDKDEETIEDGWRFTNSKHINKEHYLYHSLDKAIDAEEKYKRANYFFIDQPVADKSSGSSNGSSFFVTPYSIIGEKEINHLRKYFYKNIDQNIASAMKTLDIQNYSELYKLYSQGSMDEEFMGNYGLYLKFVNSPSCLVYSNSGYGERCMIENYFQHSIRDLNKKIHGILGKESNLPYEKWIAKGDLKFKKNEFEKYTPIGRYKDMLPDFLSFIFSMPYEDQNIHVNKEILKSYAENMDYPEIMANEYASGRHFKDYFLCLNPAQQKNVVRNTKNAHKKDLTHDSFLWSKGFKEISRDYMNLYQHDADEFIDYFKSRNQDDKKTILKDIMNCDYTNKTAEDWLNENETELLRESSFSDKEGV